MSFPSSSLFGNGQSGSLKQRLADLFGQKPEQGTANQLEALRQTTIQTLPNVSPSANTVTDVFSEIKDVVKDNLGDIASGVFGTFAERIQKQLSELSAKHSEPPKITDVTITPGDPQPQMTSGIPLMPIIIGAGLILLVIVARR